VAKEVNDSGFSHIPRAQGARLINKDGSSNVNKEGLSFIQRFSMFHFLISMGWISFVLTLFAGFILLNVVFAGVYLLVGIEGIGGVENLAVVSDFMKAFYFSTQALTTVGFGQLHPITDAISIIAAVESFIGLLAFAMATGLLYGRFSKPKAKLIFSDHLLYAPFKEGNALMLRLANSKESQIIDVTADVFFTYIDTIGEEPQRKYFNLPLEISKINILATSWTLVHPLDADSPIAHFTQEDYQKSDAEVLIQIQGFDVTYNQMVNTRTSYKASEMVWGAKFKRIFGSAINGEPTINLGELSTYEKL
jgi:inward rectifier potassium channel